MRPLKLINNFRYFESQEKDEKVVLITRKHWLMLIYPFILGTFVSFLLIYFVRLSVSSGELTFGTIDPNARVSFELIVVLFVILVAFGSWIVRYLNVLILTNKHIVDVSQKAFFVRTVSTLALSEIEDVVIDKSGILATVLDYGNIKIQTAGELPNFELKSIADPETVQRKIMEEKGHFRNKII